MRVSIESPFGVVTATVKGGFMADAEVMQDGTVHMSFLPMEKPPGEEHPCIGD